MGNGKVTTVEVTGGAPAARTTEAVARQKMGTKRGRRRYCSGRNKNKHKTLLKNK